MKKEIAYCGVDCSECPDYINKACVGCKNEEWKETEMCALVFCCLKNGAEYCGLCKSFPCADIKEFGEESESHMAALRIMEEMKAKQCQNG